MAFYSGSAMLVSGVYIFFINIYKIKRTIDMKFLFKM